jgi:hypothetical protein
MFTIKWVAVTDSLPEYSGDYLVSDGNAMMVVSYCAKRMQWNSLCSTEEQPLIDFWEKEDIAFWAHLPSLPSPKATSQAWVQE